ncbi:hypothetical protein ABK040_001290 [Willaertia magna]
MLPPEVNGDLKSIKIIFLGDKQVGKSSLIEKWTKGQTKCRFLGNYLDNNFLITKIEVNNYYIQFFEALDYEELLTNNSIRNSFFKYTDFAFIIYDINGYSSWDNASIKWLNLLQEYCKDVNIMLVGNKNDLPRRVPSIAECESFCKGFIISQDQINNDITNSGIFFIEVSCYENTNIDLTFNILLIRVSSHITRLSELEMEKEIKLLSPIWDSSENDSNSEILTSCNNNNNNNSNTTFTSKNFTNNFSNERGEMSVRYYNNSKVETNHFTNNNSFNKPSPSRLNRLPEQRSPNLKSLPISPNLKSQILNDNTSSIMNSFTNISNSSILRESSNSASIRKDTINRKASSNSTIFDSLETSKPSFSLPMRNTSTKQLREHRTPSPLRKNTSPFLRSRESTENINDSFEESLSTPTPRLPPSSTLTTSMIRTEVVTSPSKKSIGSQTPPEFKKTNTSPNTRNVQHPVVLVEEEEEEEKWLDDNKAEREEKEDELETFDNYGVRKSGYVMLPNYKEDFNEIDETPIIETKSKKQDTPSKVQGYKKTKQGYIIPSIITVLEEEPELTPKSNKNKSQQEIRITPKKQKPKLVLSIHVGDNKVCKLEVNSGDNVFHLAELVVQQCQLDSYYKSEIAYNIRTTINKYLEKTKFLEESLKSTNPKIKDAEEFNQKVSSKFTNATLVEPFNFASDYLSKAPSQRSPILQLKITIGKGKVGNIVVREGDDIHILAKNFVSTYGLKKDMTSKIEDKIQKHLELYYQEKLEEQTRILEERNNALIVKKQQRGDEYQLLGPSPIMKKSSNNKSRERELNELAMERRILFNMDVEISQNNRKMLTVREGDTPVALAKQFSQKYLLSDKAEQVLIKLIQFHLKQYYDKN